MHFEPRSVIGEKSPHAWRDPFVFLHGGRPYMLLAAKSKHCPIHRKGAVALLRAKYPSSLLEWEVVGAGYAPGTCGEIEVPQLYINSADEYVLMYSCHAEYDFAPSTNGRGGLQAVVLGNSTDSIESLFARTPYVPATVLVPEGPSYACRVIPELGGLVVGFDITSVSVNGRRLGGFCNTETYFPEYRHCNRDFSAFAVPGGKEPPLPAAA